jgi:hypothetical protein
MRFYITKLGIRHRITTPYYSRTNGKVENLNNTLRRMLTKLIISKPTKLWDKYLPQALFSARVRIHATSKISPFYLIYGIHPRISFNANPSRPEKLTIDAEQILERIRKLHTIRIAANEKLLIRAERTQKARAKKVEIAHLEKGD